MTYIPLKETKVERLKVKGVHDGPVDSGIGEMEVDDGALVQKIDWYILSILFFAYFLQFLDKVASVREFPLRHQKVPTPYGHSSRIL
jgi:hypothetical protein